VNSIREAENPRTPSYRGVGVLRAIRAAKEAVSIEEVARLLSGPGVKRGREIAYLCPLHDDHDPSLRVDPEKGVWFCDPCLVGGDAIALARAVWEIERPDVAAAELLVAFGHGDKLPKRPASWFAKERRQKAARDLIEEARVQVLMRRLWK
jgi:DNA primase